jgi:hypothetical protein
MDFEQFAALYKIAGGHRLEPQRLGLATAPGLVPIHLQFDKFWKARDQLRDPPSFIIG